MMKKPCNHVEKTKRLKNLTQLHANDKELRELQVMDLLEINQIEKTEPYRTVKNIKSIFTTEAQSTQRKTFMIYFVNGLMENTSEGKKATLSGLSYIFKEC